MQTVGSTAMFNSLDVHRLDEGMVLYFAFGSNLDESQMKTRIVDRGGCVQGPVLARLRGYRLEFSKKASKGHNGYANVHKDCSQSETLGFLYALDKKGFELLDGYEGCRDTRVMPENTEPGPINHYYRQACKVEIVSSGKYVEAVLYKAHSSRVNNGLRPTKDYAARLVAGHRLMPRAYIESIIACACRPSDISERRILKPSPAHLAVSQDIPIAIFAYGTLRGDFGPSGDRWGVIRETHAVWSKAAVVGFKLFQTKTACYPFCVRTNQSQDVVHGTVLMWTHENDAKEALVRCNHIEGYVPGKAGGLFERELVDIVLVQERRPMKAYIYYQVSDEDMLSEAIAFPFGDWSISPNFGQS